MRYTQLYEGSRLRFIGDRDITFSCCDCGMTHGAAIANPKPKVVEVTITLNRRATAGRRRSAQVRERIREMAK